MHKLANLATRPESDGVYIELVSALFRVFWPTVIMTAIFTVVAAFTYATSAERTGAAAAVIGLAGVTASASKLILQRLFRRRPSPWPLTAQEARRWERWYRYCAWGFSIAVRGDWRRDVVDSRSDIGQLLLGFDR